MHPEIGTGSPKQISLIHWAMSFPKTFASRETGRLLATARFSKLVSPIECCLNMFERVLDAVSDIGFWMTNFCWREAVAHLSPSSHCQTNTCIVHPGVTHEICSEHSHCWRSVGKLSFQIYKRTRQHVFGNTAVATKCPFCVLFASTEINKETSGREWACPY